MRSSKAQILSRVHTLELFEPDTHEYEYKVIVTNKTASARKVLRFHNGRAAA